MPKGVSTTVREKRINELKVMSGTDFAIQTAADLLLLKPEERAKALSTLKAVNEAVSAQAH